MWSLLNEEISKYKSEESDGVVELFKDLPEEAGFELLTYEKPEIIELLRKQVPENEVRIHKIFKLALNHLYRIKNDN